MNLSELIDTHRGGRSYAELERDCGGAPSKGRLQQLVRQSIKNFPDPPTVRALARGLKVSQAAVVLAAAESLGLDVRGHAPRLVELLSSDAVRLTERQAAAVAHLVETIVEGMPATEVGTEKGPEPDLIDVRAAQLRAVEEQGRLFGGKWAAALENALRSDDERLLRMVPDLISRTAESGAAVVDLVFTREGERPQVFEVKGGAEAGPPTLHMEPGVDMDVWLAEVAARTAGEGNEPRLASRRVALDLAGEESQDPDDLVVEGEVIEPVPAPDTRPAPSPRGRGPRR